MPNYLLSILVTGRGLLHGIPRRYRKDLSDALMECVQEVAIGSRMAAVQELLEILSQFVMNDQQM